MYHLYFQVDIWEDMIAETSLGFVRVLTLPVWLELLLLDADTIR